MIEKALPLGVQTFEKIIKGNYVYVDKTDLVYKLVTDQKFNFISRPRRFGKSLLLTTLKSYFEGRKDLFKGLKIETLEKEWKKYPVFRFDLNSGVYYDKEGVADYLSGLIAEYEDEYNIIDVNINNVYNDFVMRFRRLIKTAYKQTGREVVILIDEYEKPLLETINNPELQERHRGYLKPFYSILKNMEEYIFFVMITGVTRLGHMSIFSDLNNIRDISLDPKYSTICGFTQEEIDNNFSFYISELSQKRGWDYNLAINKLREKYDGYRFTELDTKVFNPYSLLNCFRDMELNNYWFQTGKPSFLINILRKHRLAVDKLEGYEATRDLLTEVDDKYSSPIPLLYQSGYLTIIGCEKDDKQTKYILDFPNEEVRHGFFVSFLKYYSQDPYLNVDSVIDKIVSDVKKGDAEDIIIQIGSIIMSLPYSPRENYEFFYQDAVAVIFMLLGIRIKVEYKMLTGSVDCVIEDKGYVYIIEFKVDKSPQEALKQIYDKKYFPPFEGSGKKIFLMGINFGTNPRGYEYLIQ